MGPIKVNDSAITEKWYAEARSKGVASYNRLIAEAKTAGELSRATICSRPVSV